MNKRRSLSVLGVALVGAALLGCSSSGADAASSAAPSSSSAAKPGGSGSGATATPPPTAAPKPAGVLTKGEVEGRDGKSKIAFSIELPEGLKDVSDPKWKGAVDYRKEAKAYDSYGFSVTEANEKFVELGLDGFLAEASKNPDFVKNKVQILDKAKTDNGWYMARSLEEGTKKEVGVMLIVTDKGVSLMCRAEVEGALAVPEVAPGVLLGVCKTLKITGT